MRARPTRRDRPDDDQKGSLLMPALRPRRYLSTVLMILAAYFVVTQPRKAASAVNVAVDGIQKITESLTTFSNALG
jgi:hypothetical protein